MTDVEHGYDVVIVGAGPAGSMTALSILKNDPEKKVLMVDRRKEIGRPVQCAGGIVKYWLDQVDIQVPDEVVATRLRGAVLHGPGGTEAVLDGSRLAGDEPLGYVMYRDRFDQWLAAMACEAGADLQLRTDPSTTGYRYDSDYLVGADGWRSQVAHFFGFRRELNDDRHRGLEYHVSLEEPCDPSYIHMYFGNDIAPGGYVWVFPESKDVARVGCGVEPPFMPKPWLDRFLYYNAPVEWKGEVLGVSAGGIIPASKPARALYSDVLRPDIRLPSMSPQQVVVVGDAARMTDPLHGGGIANGMIAGKRLGETIAAGEDLIEWSKWFWKGLGKELMRRYTLAQVLTSWSDPELDAMIEVFGEYETTDEPVNTQVRKLVLRLLKRKPLMFPKALFTALKEKFRS